MCEAKCVRGPSGLGASRAEEKGASNMAFKVFHETRSFRFTGRRWSTWFSRNTKHETRITAFRARGARLESRRVTKHGHETRLFKRVRKGRIRICYIGRSDQKRIIVLYISARKEGDADPYAVLEYCDPVTDKEYRSRKISRQRQARALVVPLTIGTVPVPACLTTRRGEVRERTVRARRKPGGGKRRKQHGL